MIESGSHAVPRSAVDRAPPPVDVRDLVTRAVLAVRDAAVAPPRLDDIARWCAESGGVDPLLEQAALRHARGLVVADALIADVVAAFRVRLAAAGPLLPAMVAHGGVPRVLASIGGDDVDPPAGALRRDVPPRIGRFYWQRLRGFVAWTAACALA